MNDSLNHSEGCWDPQMQLQNTNTAVYEYLHCINVIEYNNFSLRSKSNRGWSIIET